MPVPLLDADAPHRLAAGARRMGLDMDPRRTRILLRYLEELLEAGRRVNLLGTRDPGAAVERHLVDSLAFGLHLEEVPLQRRDAVLLDLGTGGGFPGVPAAVALPGCLVHLVEGRGRKAAAVARCIRSAGIPNARVQHGRLADLLRAGALAPASAHLVLARAVGPLDRLVREAAPVLAPGGALLAWKSPAVEGRERRAGERAAAARGLEPMEAIPYVSDAASLLLRYWRPLS